MTETELSPNDAVLQFGNDSREADLIINLGFAKSIEADPTVDSIQGAVAKWLKGKEDGGFEKRWNTWTVSSLNAQHLDNVVSYLSMSLYLP